MSLADMQAAFAAALTDPSRPVPPGITTARGGPAAPRFAVYRNNVAVGLAAALAARFPVVARLVGEDFFRAIARAYVERHKPASPLLFEYGDEFPGFVAAFGPASVLPYLPDVARLEAAWSRAYHAADARPLDLGDLAAMAPDDLPAVRLAPHPSAAVVRSGHPIGAIWQAHRHEPVEAVRDWRHESVLVVRPDAAVAVHVLPCEDAPFAAAVIGGSTLGEAAAAAGADPDFDFGRAVVGLLSLGAFAAVLPPD